VELTQWCAINTQPLYPIGLAVGTSFTAYWVHTIVCLGCYSWLEHFTWKSFFTFHNLLCSVVNEQSVQEYFNIRTSVSLYKKAIHPLITHWATPFTFLEEGVLLPEIDRKEMKAT
jgi:hypothetical protein